MRTKLPFALLLGACVGSSPSDTAQVASNLETTTGGYELTDEAPLFAADSEYTAAAIEMPTATADTTAADPTVVAMKAAGAEGIEVNLVWGHMPADPDDHSPRIWDGSLTVSRGALIVEHTIRFEGNDHLLPRMSRQTVSFESQTYGYQDGLALKILDPDATAATGPLTLTYIKAIPPGSAQPIVPIVFDLGQLRNGPIVVDFEDGNKMIAMAERDHDGCLGGFMRGRWHQLPSSTANGVKGRFLGIVTDRHGEHVGHIRGIYGQRKNGEHVVFGKFIDREGHFQGIVRGTDDDDGAPKFKFAARWTDRDHDERGRIRGEFVEGTKENSGTFVARWAETSCSEDAATTVPK